MGLVLLTILLIVPICILAGIQERKKDPIRGNVMIGIGCVIALFGIIALIRSAAE